MSLPRRRAVPIGVEGACLLPAAPIASPAEPSVPSAGQNADVSLSLQFSTEAKHSPDMSQSSSGDKVSLQSVSSRGRASTAAGKRKTDGHASQKQHLMDPTGSQVKHDLHWLMPGTFLLPLRSEGSAYSGGSMSPRAWCGRYIVQGASWAWLEVGTKPCALAEKLYWVVMVCRQSAVLADVAASGGQSCGMLRPGACKLGSLLAEGCALQGCPLELLACSFVLVSC